MNGKKGTLDSWNGPIIATAPATWPQVIFV
jgi:hypothetical protein